MGDPRYTMCPGCLADTSIGPEPVDNMYLVNHYEHYNKLATYNHVHYYYNKIWCFARHYYSVNVWSVKLRFLLYYYSSCNYCHFLLI